MDFSHPSFSIFFLLLIFLIALFIYERRWKKSVLSFFAEKTSLDILTVRYSERISRIRTLLILVVFMLIVFSLMDPRGLKSESLGDKKEQQKEIIDEKIVQNLEGEKAIRKRRSHDVIFLLDTSASMSVDDTRINKSRLEFAKEIIDEVVSLLDGQSAALYSFTSEATPIVPSTLDYLYLRLLLKGIGINEGDVAGTDLLEALDVIKKKHFKFKEKSKSIILLTDGGDTRLEGIDKQAREKGMLLFKSRLDKSKENKLTLYAVGLGTKEGEVIPDIEFEGSSVKSTLDEELLQILSKEGNGDYFFANHYSTYGLAREIVSQIKKNDVYIDGEEENMSIIERDVKETSPKNISYKNYYQIPLGFAILLLTFELLFPFIFYIKPPKFTNKTGLKNAP